MSLTSGDAWRTLAEGTSPTRGEFQVFETSTSSAEGPVLLALDGNGFRHVLIPIRNGSVFEPDQRSNGVHILGRVLIDHGAESSFVDVVCRKEHLSEVFGYLADEILHALESEPGRAATVAKRVLNRWRELIERDRPTLLSREALAGLFGELWLLRQLARESASALKSWTGPLGARFDFQAGATAVEVKTSLSRHALLVQIHGIDQLDPPPDQALYLLVVAVEAPVSAGTSVPSIVEQIRELGIDVLEFSSKLHAVGYAAEDASYYEETRFLVASEHTFHVDDAFPRIVQRSFLQGKMPDRVRNLSYSLDLSAAPPSPISVDDAKQVWRRLAPP